MSIEIKKYIPECEWEWNDFVRCSRNGTFLLQRGYMDYHADRFEDSSLMFYDEKNRLIGLLPACRQGDKLVSHAGLTYGGFVIPMFRVGAVEVMEMLQGALAYCRKCGLRQFMYKSIPHIYHQCPSEEDVYALFRAGAKIEAVNIASTIDVSDGRAIRLKFDATNRRHLRKAYDAGISASVSEDYASFWEMLSERLAERYDAKPVHTLSEIQRLATAFPENIKLVMSHDAAGEPLAGSVVFITDTCVHLQYIATNEAGRKAAAFTTVMDYIANNIVDKHCWIDMGTCNEDGGRYLNESLLDQKNRLGGRGIAYVTYSLSTGVDATESEKR